jgi:Zn-dependent protease with chaperone function
MMSLKTRATKIARLAFHQQQAKAEQAVMRRTANPRAELALIKEAFGQDVLEQAVKGPVRVMSNLQKAGTVRDKAMANLAKELLPAERAVAATMARTRGASDWMKRLPRLEKTLQAPPEAQTRKAVAKLVRQDFDQARKAAMNVGTEVTAGKQTIEAYKAQTKIWATLENLPELWSNFKKTGRFRHSDVVWVSRQTGIEHDRVKAIMDQLSKVAPDRPYPLETTVFQRDIPNAFSAGGGQFGVHTSLLKMAKTDDELAFILAHELAHDVHRDVAASRQILTRVRTWDKQAQAEGVSKEARAKVKGLFEEQKAVVSRIKEAQADADGIRYAARAGFDPRKGAEFLNTIDPTPMADKVYLENGYPPTRKRIEAMKSIIKNEKL